jgi:hypothetical protein
MELSELLEEIPITFRINDWFQHDGVPPQFSREVCEILNQQYRDRWIG